MLRCTRIAALAFLTLAAGARGKMVSVFSRAEADFDRYAAALAAMEPLKAELAAEVSSSAPFRAWYWSKVKRGSVCDAGFDPKNKNLRRRRACADYILRSSAAIEAMGLDVARFNTLSRLISADKKLRQRVYQQAYLYRVGAELDTEKVPMMQPVGGDNKNPKPEKAAQLRHAAARLRESPTQRSDERARRFAHALRAVEDLRTAKLKALAHEVGVGSPNNLPTGLCDPRLVPLASPRVRKACKDFPTDAAKTASAYGFRADEFNELLKKVDSNRFFRARVTQHLQSAPRAVSAASSK